MQVPKLLGGTSGTGELPELLSHLAETIGSINIPSLILGVSALIILTVSLKKLWPKFPMAVLLMAAGAVMTYFLPVGSWGIKTLDKVEKGLPKWTLPDFSVVPLKDVITVSLSVAVVILAETLLAENNFAQKNGYKIDDNQEILAFSVGNLLASLTGCCPINGSVSRTARVSSIREKRSLWVSLQEFQ